MFKEPELEYIAQFGMNRGFVHLNELIALLGCSDNSDDRLLEAYDYMNKRDIPVIDDIDDAEETDHEDNIKLNIDIFSIISDLIEIGREGGNITEDMIFARLRQQTLIKRSIKLIYSVLEEEEIFTDDEYNDSDIPERIESYLNEQQFNHLMHSMLRSIYSRLNIFKYDMPDEQKRVKGVFQAFAGFRDKTPEYVLSTPQNRILLDCFHKIEGIIMKDVDEDKAIQNCLNVVGILEVFLAAYEGIYGGLPS